MLKTLRFNVERFARLSSSSLQVVCSMECKICWPIISLLRHHFVSGSFLAGQTAKENENAKVRRVFSSQQLMGNADRGVVSMKQFTMVTPHFH